MSCSFNPVKLSNPFGLPRENEWRLWVDRKKHAKGPYCFDKEDSPGYLQGMCQAAELSQKFFGRRLNIEDLTALHDAAVNGVRDQKKTLEKGISNFGWSYGASLNIENDLTPLFREWEEQKLVYPYIKEDVYKKFQKRIFPKAPDVTFILGKKEVFAKEGYLALGYFRAVRSSNGIVLTFRVDSLFNSERKGECNELFDRFYEEIGRASNLREKYRAVARLCRALQIFHIFPDGNGRTICMLLFNILLYQIGSSPGILIEPEVFDGSLTEKEMTQEVCESVDYVEKLRLALLIGEYAAETSKDRFEKNQTVNRLVKKMQGLTDQDLSEIHLPSMINQYIQEPEQSRQERQEVCNALIENLRAASLDNANSRKIFKKT